MNATNEINVSSEAYNTGYEAHEQGEPRSNVAAHYSVETWEAKQWLAGWDAAAGK